LFLRCVNEESTLEELRIGFVGCGAMGQELLGAAAKNASASIAAVCDVDSDAASGVAEKYAAEPYSDHAAMYEHGSLDAVMVATPPSAHERAVVDATQHGLEVFVEKPMALDVGACYRMIEAAEQADVVLMVGQVLRFIDVFAKMKEMASSGLIGRCYAVRIMRSSNGWAEPWDQDWRSNRSECGGGLFEINAHEIDYMRYLLGDVASVYAVGANYASPRFDYEDCVSVTMKFRSGAVGSLFSAHSDRISKYSGEILGDNGAIYFDRRTNTLEYKTNDDELETVPIDSIEVEEPVAHEVRLFIESILAKSEPAVPGTDGLKAVEIAQAAYISIREQREVALPLPRN